MHVLSKLGYLKQGQRPNLLIVRSSVWQCVDHNALDIDINYPEDRPPRASLLSCPPSWPNTSSHPPLISFSHILPYILLLYPPLHHLLYPPLYPPLISSLISSFMSFLYTCIPYASGRFKFRSLTIAAALQLCRSVRANGPFLLRSFWNNSD